MTKHVFPRGKFRVKGVRGARYIPLPVIVRLKDVRRTDWRDVRSAIVTNVNDLLNEALDSVEREIR